MPSRLGVKQRGKRWIARPYIRGLGHQWAGTWDTEPEAREAAIEKLNEFAQGFRKSTRYDRLETCDGFARRWARDYPRPKQSTNDLNRGRAMQFGRDFEGIRLADITRPAAREWAMKHKGAAQSIRAMFQDALNDGLIRENPFSGLRISRGKGRKEIVALTAEEVHRLGDIALEVHGTYGSTFRAAILFAAYVGLRPSELYGLQWSDIDYQAETVHIQRQVYRGEITTPKNGKPRRVILPPQAAQALKDMPRHVEPIVFLNRKGRRLDQAALHQLWAPVRAAFGSPRLAFYELRHACATYMRFELGLDSWVVAHQLGHTDGGRLVDQLYGHPSEEEARRRIREAFRGPAELSVVRDAKEASG